MTNSIILWLLSISYFFTFFFLFSFLCIFYSGMNCFWLYFSLGLKFVCIQTILLSKILSNHFIFCRSCSPFVVLFILFIYLFLHFSPISSLWWCYSQLILILILIPFYYKLNYSRRKERREGKGRKKLRIRKRRRKRINLKYVKTHWNYFI